MDVALGKGEERGGWGWGGGGGWDDSRRVEIGWMGGDEVDGWGKQGC